MGFHVFLGMASDFAVGFQNLGPRSKSVYGVAGNVIKEGYMKDCGMQTHPCPSSIGGFPELTRNTNEEQGCKTRPSQLVVNKQIKSQYIVIFFIKLKRKILVLLLLYLLNYYELSGIRFAHSRTHR
jgi:hypothetical protein